MNDKTQWTLELTNIIREISIGISEEEQAKLQRVRLDVFIDICEPDPDDEISSTLDYDIVRQIITDNLNKPAYALQETLVKNIAKDVLIHPKALAVCIKCKKLDIAPDWPEVGVKLFLKK